MGGGSALYSAQGVQMKTFPQIYVDEHHPTDLGKLNAPADVRRLGFTQIEKPLIYGEENTPADLRRLSFPLINADGNI